MQSRETFSVVCNGWKTMSNWPSLLSPIAFPFLLIAQHFGYQLQKLLQGTGDHEAASACNISKPFLFAEWEEKHISRPATVWGLRYEWKDVDGRKGWELWWWTVVNVCLYGEKEKPSKQGKPSQPLFQTGFFRLFTSSGSFYLTFADLER